MPLDLANLSHAANGFQRQRRAPADVPRPEAAKRNHEAEQRPRKDHEPSRNQVEARERPTPTRRSAAANAESRQTQGPKEGEFRRRLEDGTAAQLDVPAAAGDAPQVLADGLGNEAVDEGLTLGLLLPAALGEHALSQVDVEVAASSEAIPEGAVLTELGALVDPEAALPAEQETGESALHVAGDPALVLPQGQTGEDATPHSQAIIEVTVAGEIVPVTLHVLAPEVASPPPVPQEGQIAALPATLVASPTAVISDGEAVPDPALLKAAPVALAVPGQEGVRIQDPQIIQVAQQAVASRNATAIQTVQAPAAVAEAAVLALPVEGEPAQQPSLNFSSNNAQLSVNDLRPVTPAAPPAPPQANADAAADKAVQNQVTRAIVQQMANGDRSLTLRLTPPNLGTVRIELVESRGVITVRFHAEDDKVRQAIERQLPQLRQDLRAVDAPISSLRMEDGPHGWHQGQHQHGQHAGQFQERRGGGPAFSLDGGFAEEEAESATESTPQSLGGEVSDEAVDARA